MSTTEFHSADILADGNNHTDNDRPIAPANFTLLRGLLSSHPQWQEFSAREGIANTSELTRAHIRQAFNAANYSIPSMVDALRREHRSGNTGATKHGKEYTEHSITAVQERIMNVRQLIRADYGTSKEREKARGICDTISQKQHYQCTLRQWAALGRYINSEEQDGTRSSDAYESENKQWYAEEESAHNQAAHEATSAAFASAANTDPAGAALAALIGPHILPAVRDSVIALVQKELANVQQLVIKLERHDGTQATFDGVQHPSMAKLARAVTARNADGYVPNIWLAGPSGTGKTHAAKQLATALDTPFGTAGAMEMSYELMGFISGGTNEYRPTIFRQIFEHGGIMLLDEVDAYLPNAILALNAALANGWCAFPDGMVKRHLECVIIGTGNTWGKGATSEFTGRERLDGATLNRFPVKIEWPLDEKMETAISGNADFARVVQRARDKAKAAGLEHDINTRHVQAGAALIAAGFSEQEAAEMTYLAGLDPDQRAMIS